MKKVTLRPVPIDVYQTKLSNGMRVILVPRRHVQSTYVHLEVETGSYVERGALHLNQQKVNIPKGVSHFLEHRLFEAKAEPLFSFFSKYGAELNGGTGIYTTSYYFNTVGDTTTLLKKLLTYVQDYDDHQDQVEKESKIILEEFSRSKNNLEEMIQKAMLKKVYPHHPIAEEVLGTRESIQGMHVDCLKAFHATFYHPSNMVLTMVGKLNPKVLLKSIVNIENRIKLATRWKWISQPLANSITVATHQHRLQFPVSENEIRVVIKIKPPVFKSEKDNQKWMAHLRAFNFFHWGSSSRLQEMWYKAGLIETPLMYQQYNYKQDYCFVMFEVVSKKPKQFMESLKQTLSAPIINVKEDDHILDAFKKARLGQQIRELNNLESFAQTLSEDVFDHVPYLYDMHVIRDLKFSDLEAIKAVYQHIETHIFHIYK